jgi:2',3'-cyclic-nucleotide 2'-phosphodiesterase (5'-nucleotidase family)
MYTDMGQYAEGNITVRDSMRLLFDNSITFLELKGSDLKKIFDAYAGLAERNLFQREMTIKERKVSSVTVDGLPLMKTVYKISTLDYLADGNNDMDRLRNAIKVTHTGITLRDVMIDYVKEQTRQGARSPPG